jgi:hypothetical protein
MTKFLTFSFDSSLLVQGDERGSVQVFSLETNSGVVLSSLHNQLNLVSANEWPLADGEETRAFSIALGSDRVLFSVDPATMQVALILTPGIETLTDRGAALGIGDRPKIKLGSVDVSGARQIPLNAVDLRQIHGGIINPASRDLDSESVIYLQLELSAFKLHLRKSGDRLEVASSPLHVGNIS